MFQKPTEQSAQTGFAFARATRAAFTSGLLTSFASSAVLQRQGLVASCHSYWRKLYMDDAILSSEGFEVICERIEQAHSRAQNFKVLISLVRVRFALQYTGTTFTMIYSSLVCDASII